MNSCTQQAQDIPDQHPAVLGILEIRCKTVAQTCDSVMIRKLAQEGEYLDLLCASAA